MRITRAAFAIALGLPLTACIVGDSSTGGSKEDIIGGTVDLGDPSVVAIFAHQPGATSGSICTGTVIAPTTVLTAAHCVDPRVVGDGNVFDVYVGTQLGENPPLAVASVKFDPAFDVNNLEGGHDIAVVKLAQPTALAPLPVNRGALGKGPVRLVGFGMSTHANFPNVPSGVGVKRQVTTTIQSATDTLVTIGDTSNQTCHGDSGGPAFQVIDGQEVIIGVTSFGSDLSTDIVCLFGGTDTRVDAYTAFIDANK
jgi:secreted trypsin-like serine protease